MNAAFFDLDGTLTTTHVWAGLIAYFKTHKQRQGTHLAFLAVHYPPIILYKMGLVSQSRFRTPWAAHLAWYVRGYTLDQAAAVWAWVADSFLAQYWREDAMQLLQQHRAQGDLVMLVSGSPQPLLRRIAQALGVAHAVGTQFAVKDGRYTGGAYSVCIGEKKPDFVRAYLAAEGLRVDMGKSYAYADSLTDLELLEMVGHPTAVHPEPALREIADQRGWPVFPPA